MSDPPAFHDVIVAFLRWLASVLARYTPHRPTRLRVVFSHPHTGDHMDISVTVNTPVTATAEETDASGAAVTPTGLTWTLDGGIPGATVTPGADTVTATITTPAAGTTVVTCTDAANNLTGTATLTVTPGAAGPPTSLSVTLAAQTGGTP